MLTLTFEQWTMMTRHLTASLPEEACGLIAGRMGRAEHVYLITNAAHSPSRFFMEPTELLAALEEMDSRGWDLLAIFHSHPAGPPTPSATDVAEAFYPDSLHLVCAPSDSGWQARAFEIRDGRTRESPFEITAPASNQS